MASFDPGRPHEQHSLFGEILDWMLAPLLLVWPMSVVLTWLVAQGIANRPYDRELGELVRGVARQLELKPAADGNPRNQSLALPRLAAEMLRSDETDRVFILVLGARGELVAGDPALPLDEDGTLPPVGEIRFRDAEINNEPVRVAMLRPFATPDAAGNDGAGGPLVQVAETLDKRSQLATEIIKGVILPQFIILPLAVLLVWLALARGIAPLTELQKRIRRRESHDLSPIDERFAPEEVAPLVRAINDLLARLDTSLGLQRQFLADAAHQLKTPLAGLRMQAELAQREIDAGSAGPQQLKGSLRQIARSSQSAAHMVNQLLAMARAEDRGQTAARQTVNLARLATEAVRDFVPRAMEKRIDLGYEGPASGDRPPLVTGQPLMLRELIRNLVDNALQYTPSGGTVTVRVVSDPFGQVVVLQVEDNGPGIPAAERDKVFQPFYRALGTQVDGSGLGLAIVRRVADEHGADLTVEDAEPRPRGDGRGPGARFTLRFPAAPASAAVASAPAAAGGDDPLSP
jgi:two-component system sensor histidine kinase TctE